jgi:hypothetical protein
VLSKRCGEDRGLEIDDKVIFYSIKLSCSVSVTFCSSQNLPIFRNVFSQTNIATPRVLRRNYDQLAICNCIYLDLFCLTAKEGTTETEKGYTETTHHNSKKHAIYASGPRGKRLLPTLHEFQHRRDTIFTRVNFF